MADVPFTGTLMAGWWVSRQTANESIDRGDQYERNEF
jgi:hypothetical protein